MAKNKNYFEPVDLKIDFPLSERKQLEQWYKNGVVAKYLHRNDSAKRYFSFMDGPITANNPMGVHHAWGRTYKDLWQKYKNMQGFKQRFQNGFDCQGLWVEVEVEKELGLRTKKDIENLVPGDKKESIAKFVNLCKERVLKYAAIQTDQTKRLGNFMDWDNSYFTMSDDNNYTIWHFLKVCHESGWIYKGRDSVPWCPRCETAISQHEMLTEDYKEAVHKSVYLELPVENRESEFFLVWTTTPWTIPANIAIAVDEKLDYCLVEGRSGDRYWLLKDRVYEVVGKEAKILKTQKGKDLVGLKYKAPFDGLPAVKKASRESKLFHTVIATDERIMPISAAEGTGIVHTAVSAGAEDFRLGKKLNLPMIPVITDDASYLDGLGFLSGKNAKKHPEVILDYLAEREKYGENWIFNIENYKHRYPACWRCKTELVWKVADEWYISMDKKDDKGQTLRQRMVKVAKRINWLPEFGLDRELDWLVNMHDWLISKPNRYWGLALPIYECAKCGDFDVIGGREELESRASEGWDSFDGNSPHKPWIDEVKINCKKCGGKMDRILDVGNVWLDAGIVPFSTIKENNQGAPLYTSDKAKWEKWFPVDFITESFPGQFKNWFYSMIAMSTVLEDKNPFKNVLGFGSLLAEDGRPMHKSWGNSIEFNEGADKIGADVMRWMYLRANPFDNMLFGYKIADETRRQFHLKLWNVYNYFVTYANLAGFMPNKGKVVLTALDRWILSRLNSTVAKVTSELDEFRPHGASAAIESFLDDLSVWYIRRSREREDDAFFSTLHECLVNLAKLLAPFLPFISEAIFKNLTKEESVHLANFPSADHTYIDGNLEQEMQMVRKIVELSHSARKESQIKVRQPLRFLKIHNLKSLHSDLRDLIAEEINVKNLEFIEGKGEVTVELDTDITPELEEEGAAREIIRNIQIERKNLGTKMDQMVNVVLPEWPEKFTEEIKRKALVADMKKGDFKVTPVN